MHQYADLLGDLAVPADHFPHVAGGDAELKDGLAVIFFFRDRNSVRLVNKVCAI